MSETLLEMQAKLDQALMRIQRLEEQVDSSSKASPPYSFLVERPHPWRRQLSLKGRNLTVGQLVSTLKANCLTPEVGAREMDLPVEAIREALDYYAANETLIQLEASEERRYLGQRGYRLEPQNLPR